MTSRDPRRRILAVALPLLLTGCLWDNDDAPAPPTAAPPAAVATTWTVGGAITGLSATGLVLANGNDVSSPAADATGFTLPTAVASGGNYAVTVQTQPDGEHCSVTNASGTIAAANVTNVTVACAANAYLLGGTISGLPSTGLVLANGTDTLSPAAGATTFVFADPVAEGSAYAVGVQAQPQGATCSVGSGSATMGASDATSVKVTCSANAYKLGGTISGLTATGLILANGTDTVSPAANASAFTFASAVAFDGSYDVAVLQQPAGQTCVVAGDFPATMGPGDVTDVAVTCSASSGLLVVAGQATCPSVTNVDGNGAHASIADGEAMAFDRSGNLFVTGGGTKTIRRIAPNGDVTTLAGQYGGSGGGITDGTGSQATFNFPLGLGVDNVGNVYVDDSDSVRKVTQAGVVTTLAGTTTSGPGDVDGTGAAAMFHGIRGMAVDTAGNAYIADTGNYAIRKMTPAGVVTTFAGGGSAGGAHGYADGVGTAALFAGPTDVAIDAAGNLYVADANNQAIRMITPAGVVTTLAGGGPTNYGFADGAGSAARFSEPMRLAMGPAGSVFVMDQFAGSGGAIRMISAGGVVTTIAVSQGVVPTGAISPTSVVLPGQGSAGVLDIATNAAGTLYLSFGCAVARLGQ